MKKQILTKDNIKFDLHTQIEHERARYKSDCRTQLFKWEFRTIIGFAMIGTVCCIAKMFVFAAASFALAAAFLAILLIPIFIRGKRLRDSTARRLQMLDSESFRIVGDTLENARPDGNGLSLGNNESPYLLVFSRYGRYFVPSRTNYSWSKDYYMSPKGVYNTSIVGDKFYLVIYPTDAGDEIGMVYNTKLFELTEDDPFDYEELS